MIAMLEPVAAANRSSLQRYYRRHAPIYDLTRWTFLFGRDRLLRLFEQGPAPSRVLEVGCGTGRNLARLARSFPQASFTGVDLSEPMLSLARRRTSKLSAQFHWVNAAYDQPLSPAAEFDLVLFSYSLSMMNPGWQLALKCAARDLAPGGQLAVVDFHQTPLRWFRQWMAKHEVRLEGHLFPALCKRFRPRLASREPAYVGAWDYFLFIGTTRTQPNPPRMFRPAPSTAARLSYSPQTV